MCVPTALTRQKQYKRTGERERERQHPPPRGDWQKRDLFFHILLWKHVKNGLALLATLSLARSAAEKKNPLLAEKGREPIHVRAKSASFNHGHNSLMAVLQLKEIESNSQPTSMLASFYLLFLYMDRPAGRPPLSMFCHLFPSSVPLQYPFES